ncbi:MAG: hypothetical protein IAG13_39270 [Deltaproteobacteria bacterium]|nr:hypothetical protein [Nannocystaceae bacterium]
MSLLVALGGAAACTAILAPDDDVQRCGNADDCDPTGDKRYVPLCTSSDLDIDTTEYEKICVASIASITCDNPENYQGKPFNDTFEDDSCRDLSCAAENEGRLGCAPKDGECLEGERMDFPVDDDTVVSYCGTEGVVPGFGLRDELEGRHIFDQFCKSYFCDDEFVCNKSGKCDLCDPDAAYGEGGCGTVYNDGAPAAVYVLGEALEDGCAGPDANVNEPLFGAC